MGDGSLFVIGRSLPYAHWYIFMNEQNFKANKKKTSLKLKSKFVSKFKIVDGYGTMIALYT